jgi:hypothetical protein
VLRKAEKIRISFDNPLIANTPTSRSLNFSSEDKHNFTVAMFYVCVCFIVSLIWSFNNFSLIFLFLKLAFKIKYFFLSSFYNKKSKFAQTKNMDEANEERKQESCE